MKTTFYILGSIGFGALIFFSNPLPAESSETFRENQHEIMNKEKILNQKIVQAENRLNENKELILTECDSTRVIKK